MTDSDIRIAEARWPAERDIVATLFHEYVVSLAVDISFQDVVGELASLPGKYERPGGVVLIAWKAEEVAGVIAYRPFKPGICEMKRLYVRPHFRNRRIGQRLAQALIGDARAHGYRSMVLDTLESMRSANELYRSLGFRDVPAYYENPLSGVRYMELDL